MGEPETIEVDEGVIILDSQPRVAVPAGENSGGETAAEEDDEGPPVFLE